MAKKKTAESKFAAQFKLELWVEVPVQGTTFEEALANSKEMQVADCLTFKHLNGYLDGDMKLSAVTTYER
jgi:hypothetical protein